MQQHLKIFKKFVAFACFSSVYASLCAAALTILALHYWQLNISNYLLHQCTLFVLCATLLMYNANNLYKHYEQKIQSARNTWNHHNVITLWVLLSLGLAGLCIVLKDINHQQLLALAILGICSVVYCFPVFIWKKKKVNIKSINYIKPFYLALVWTITTTSTPLIFNEQLSLIFSENYLAIFSSYYTLLLPLCLIFDIKDRTNDKMINNHSFATELTMRSNILIIFIAIVIQTIVGIILLLNNQNDLGIANLSVSLCLYYITSFHSKKFFNEFFQLSVIDGIMFVYVGVYFVYSFL